MKALFILVIYLFSLPSEACIQGVFQAKSQALSQQLQQEQQAAQQILQLADQRFRTIKDSRNDILKSWINYVESKNKAEREIANAPVKIREAELTYQSDLLTLKRECRQQANDHQQRVNEQVLARPVTTNPTRTGGSRRRQQNEWQRALNQCMRDPIMVDSIKLAHKKMDNALRGIQKEKEDQLAALQVLHKRTVAIQQNALLTRREAMANLDYKEGVIRQMQARALSLTRQQASLAQTGAALQCFAQMFQGAGSKSQGSRAPSNN